ncbi:hypothetical protein RchiOBHm_Chr5g0021661 [Rosa chinensis]|uniref:Uncharacterized protein n=1 Tax=Rosa chinensis TaxID=74649 RepID=A0A2P6Q7L6_ROSCH|nr:hypothetical protein RchiOBHm_Chr5g0021661 [Rosa chinensis]
MPQRIAEICRICYTAQPSGRGIQIHEIWVRLVHSGGKVEARRRGTFRRRWKQGCG